MSTLFIKGSYIEGIIIAYLLPTVYSLVAYFSSKKDGYIIHLLHFITFLIISIINAYLLFFISKTVEDDGGAYLGIALIAAVMSIMQYPKAGLRGSVENLHDQSQYAQQHSPMSVVCYGLDSLFVVLSFHSSRRYLFS